MPFLLMLLLTVACLPVRWPPPPQSFDAWGSTAATWFCMGLMVLVSAALAWYTRMELARHPFRRDTFARRHATWRFYHLCGLIVAFLLSLYCFGWGWVVQGAQPIDTEIPAWPGSEFLVLAPLLVTLVLSWACFYDLERALHDSQIDFEPVQPFWGRGAYVSFHLRHHLALVFVPVLLMVTINNLPRIFPVAAQTFKSLANVMTMFALLFVLAVMPWVVRLVLKLEPLPEGPMRDLLQTTAKRLHGRFSNLLVWNTRGGVANAMVIGPLPAPRYVIFTDRLLVEMTPDEVQGVLGHEIGHVKHWHMLYYMVFMFLSLAVISQLWDLSGLRVLLRLDAEYLEVLPLVALYGFYIFMVFGFLSRRCERQADLYGCRALSCGQGDCIGHDATTVLTAHSKVPCRTGILTFINALEKVASLNGISRDRPGWFQSWLHSTIARRVAFLHATVQKPELSTAFQRQVGWVKWGLFVILTVLFILMSDWESWGQWIFR